MATTFGAFKTGLCEELTVEYCRKLCTYFEFSTANIETIFESKPPGLAFLGELENQGQITSNDVRKLRDAFKHLKLGVADKKVEDYENFLELTESCTTLPDDLDSDEELDVTEERSCNTSFEEFKTRCGLTETLTLNKMLEIKSPERTGSLAELFWEKITSLDYRITSSDITQKHSLSVRDLMYAIFHCSDNVLRQDIVAKMSSCQLAVPLVLNRVNNGKPLFLHWAMRTIRKKIKPLTDEDPIETPMYKHETFTVSFLRIGDVNISKSDLLNSLLSDCQGNQAHSFFITKEKDWAKPFFSNGSIEVVWYIPGLDDKGSLRETISFLNLRGDSQTFRIQTEFLCKVSNLIFVLIGKQNYKAYKNTVENIRKITAKVIVLAIKETEDTKPKHALDDRYESVIVVRKYQKEVLNEAICSMINESQKSYPKLWSLENYKDHVQDIVEVDMSSGCLARIEGFVEKIVSKQVDIKKFKNKILRLFPIWLEWAKLDEMTYSTDSGIEQQRASREKEKIIKREDQIAANISDEVKAFWELLGLVDDKSNLFDDCLTYLQTLLFDLTHMHQGSSKSIQKFLHDRLQGKMGDTQVQMKTHDDLHEMYLYETNAQWQMSITVEDLMRELGQLFEAYAQSSNDQSKKVDVMRLPALAAKFIAKGNSLEMLDDKSYCVPVHWICSILDELSRLVGESEKILVLSVIGAQGSGKSTLLNSMFGTKFPVSAGRCTRGLFLRLLKVEESLATSIGCNYIIVVDTEGLKADHGGLDEASSTRLDNKMVTLAMCIADLIIVNIEGENIGTDMTNFLQIAAYALIRMKEVDLQSQCRIIQQRVSDIEAAAKNKANMLKIISNLDKAVKNVAEAEGFVDRYESFSDIFNLNVDEHTQYVCNLWSGNMNPPNHLYGKVVIKLKKQILDSISNGDLKIHFTFKTFCDRLLAVQAGLKEENFVLNFKDVSRAIMYNDFSLQCNKWLCDVQIKVMENWQKWQREMKSVESNDREKLCTKFKDELAKEIDDHRKSVTEQFTFYVQNSEKTKGFYKQYFSSWIKASLLKIECDIEIKISNEAKALQWATRDIPSFVEKETKKIRLKAIQTVTCLRETDSKQGRTPQLQQDFDKFWEHEINSILETYQSRRVSKEGIIEECTKIVIELCKGNAIESDIVRLLEKEGSILKHSKVFNSDDYLPNKTVKEKILVKWNQFRRNREKMTENIKAVVEKVKVSTLTQFETDCFRKSFDPYLVHNAFQKALSQLTFRDDEGDFKIPSSLIAKVLLNLSGTISGVATTNDEKYHTENSCQALFKKYEQDINLDFKAFYDIHQNDRAYDYVRNLILQQFRVFTLDKLRSIIIRYFCEDVVKTKYDLHIMVLKYLLDEDKPVLYLDYIHNNVAFLISWMKEIMTRKLDTMENDMSWIQFQYENVMRKVNPLSSSTVENLSKANSMEEWCVMFSNILSDLQGIQLDLKEAFIYHVSDFDELSTKIVTFWHSALFEKTKESVQLPEVGSLPHCEMFLELTLNRPFEDVISNFLGCQAQCPFCKAPCREENVESHTHAAFCHYPRGIAGKKWETNKLVEQSCTFSVNSNDVFYENNGDSFLYKDYEKHYPSWKIPTKQNMESYYWAWVFNNINDYCSGDYSCYPAEIPISWSSDITSKLARAFVEPEAHYNTSFAWLVLKRRYKLIDPFHRLVVKGEPGGAAPP